MKLNFVKIIILFFLLSCAPAVEDYFDDYNSQFTMTITETKVYDAPWHCDSGLILGNGDGIANRGESVGLDIDLKLNNKSPEIAKGVKGILISNNPYVTVNQAKNSYSYGDIYPGETTWDSTECSYIVTISASIPNGYKIQFTLTFTDDYNNSWLTSFSIVIL